MQLVKIMITQMDVYWTIHISKSISIFAIDLIKQQKLDANQKAIQQISFTGNLTREKGARMYFIIEEARKIVLDFSKGAA